MPHHRYYATSSLRKSRTASKASLRRQVGCHTSDTQRRERPRVQGQSAVGATGHGWTGLRVEVRAELLQDALVYADALLVLTLDSRSGMATEADQLIQAAFSARRAEVHQAAGVVAAQLAVSVTEALARLRAYAYSSGQSLQVVAADVMAGRLRLETDTKETGSQHAELEQEDDS